MKKFARHILFFLVFFIVAAGVLLGVDKYVFDRISNEYLIQAIQTKDVKHTVFIGSSKVKWSLMDSLLQDATVLAEGGQFTYASVAVVTALAENNLLRGREIFLDLEQSDEIASGFGQWFYFSEAFIEYRYAHFNDYPVASLPDILARIIRDISHFSLNKGKVFKWEPLEQSIRNLNEGVVPDSIIKHRDNFRHCKIPFSDQYAKSLLRINRLLSNLETKHGCKFYIILTPYPNSGCPKAYQDIFGDNRILDLALNVKYDIGDFHDNSHLNSKGALKFTTEILNRLTESPK